MVNIVVEDKEGQRLKMNNVSLLEVDGVRYDIELGKIRIKSSRSSMTHEIYIAEKDVSNMVRCVKVLIKGNETPTLHIEF